MRKLMLSVAMTAGVTMTLSASAAEAQANPLSRRVEQQISAIERINEGRPRGDVYRAIDNCVELLRGRLQLVYAGRLSLEQALAEMGDTVHAIGVYSTNGSDIAPWQHGQTLAALARLRQEIREVQIALSGGYGRHGGYGGGYGGGYTAPRYAPTQAPVYLPAPAPGYVPPPAPLRTPGYVPPPAPVQAPAPVYVPPPAPARYRF